MLDYVMGNSESSVEQEETVWTEKDEINTAIQLHISSLMHPPNLKMKFYLAVMRWRLCIEILDHANLVKELDGSVDLKPLIM